MIAAIEGYKGGGIPVLINSVTSIIMKEHKSSLSDLFLAIDPAPATLVGLSTVFGAAAAISFVSRVAKSRVGTAAVQALSEPEVSLVASSTAIAVKAVGSAVVQDLSEFEVPLKVAALSAAIVVRSAIDSTSNTYQAAVKMANGISSAADMNGGGATGYMQVAAKITSAAVAGTTSLAMSTAGDLVSAVSSGATSAASTAVSAVSSGATSAASTAVSALTSGASGFGSAVRSRLSWLYSRGEQQPPTIDTTTEPSIFLVDALEEAEWVTEPDVAQREPIYRGKRGRRVRR